MADTGSFFSHLVDALGRTDFLAPISMLLIDRSTAKAGKSGNSAAQAIDLALGVAGPSAGVVKLNVSCIFLSTVICEEEDYS